MTLYFGANRVTQNVSNGLRAMRGVGLLLFYMTRASRTVSLKECWAERRRFWQNAKRAGVVSEKPPMLSDDTKRLLYPKHYLSRREDSSLSIKGFKSL